jgi:hypothetical protein
MPRPPLQRRKSFWFGAFVLLFLGWASWQSFRSMPYEMLHCHGSSRHLLSVTRMEGATYFLRGVTAVPAGISHETIGSLHPNNFTRHWRNIGIRVHRLPDLAVAAIYLTLWIAWLAWRERKGTKDESSNLPSPNGAKRSSPGQANAQPWDSCAPAKAP